MFSVCSTINLIKYLPSDYLDLDDLKFDVVVTHLIYGLTAVNYMNKLIELRAMAVIWMSPERKVRCSDKRYEQPILPKLCMVVSGCKMLYLLIMLMVLLVMKYLKLLEVYQL